MDYVRSKWCVDNPRCGLVGDTMKKTILFICILLAFACQVEARGLSTMIMGGGVAAAGGATCQATPFYNQSAVLSPFMVAAVDTDHAYAGEQDLDFGASKSICKLEFTISCTYGTCSGGTYYAQIYTMSGTSLNTLVTNGQSGNVSGSNTWSQSVVAFTWSGSYPSVTNGTSYGVVVSSSAQGESNYIRVYGSDDDGYIAAWNTAKARYDYGAGKIWLKAYAYE
jgi:hypothetical protein